MEELNDLDLTDEELRDEVLIKNREKEKAFGTEKISKLIWKFSLPAIVGMIVNAVYNIVDSIFIGNAMGEVGLAALNFAFPVNIISLGLVLMFGAGGAALYSIRMGQKNYSQARKVLGNSIAGALLMSFIVVPIAIGFMPQILRLFATTEAALPYAVRYTVITMAGVPLVAIGTWGNNFMRATGRPLLSMYSLMLGGVINIVLDPILIFGFKLGVTGAAVATIIGQGASAIWMVIHFCSPRAKIRITKDSIIPDFKVILSVMKFGLPFLIFQSASSLVQLVINITIVKYAIIEGMNDTVAIAAMGVVQKFGTIIYMPMTGLSQGITPIMAYNYGANKLERTHKTFLYGVVAAIGFACLGFAVSRIFPTALIKFFNAKGSAEYYRVGKHIMLAWFWGLPLVAPQILAGNFYTATGKPGFSTFLALLRQVLLLVPAILIMPLIIGFDGIFYAAPVSDLLGGIFIISSLVITFMKRKRNAARLVAANTPVPESIAASLTADAIVENGVAVPDKIMSDINASGADAAQSSAGARTEEKSKPDDLSE